MKILKVLMKFSKAVWQYAKYNCQRTIHKMKAHDPDYVLSNSGKIPAYLKTKAEMANCLSLDELERL